MRSASVFSSSGRAARGFVLALAGIVTVLPLPLWAATVTLVWTPSTDPTVVGYNLYYGGFTQTYTNMVPAGNGTNGYVTGLSSGVQYFFAATAVDVAGLESPLSNEVSCQTPSTAQLFVSAANASRTYGAANPTLTGTLTGLQNGNNISATYSTVATPASAAGSYSIVPTLVDPNNEQTNYTVIINNGTLTVTPAALTITAANASKVYGAPLPALSATYTGFVNGDTAASLTAQASLSSTATAASTVGSYPISAGGAAGSNYTISYVGGTLNIQPAGSAAVVSSSTNPCPPGCPVSFTTSLSAVAPGAGVPTGTVQFMIDGAPAGSPASLSGGTATFSTSALGRGNHTIAAQYGGDGNFLGATNALSVAQLVDTSPSAGPCALAYEVTTGSKVWLPGLLSKATAAQGATVSLTSLATASANGGSVSTNGGWVFYLPTAGFTNADTFNYVISDGYLQARGVVILTLRTPSGPSANLTATALGSGSYAISGSGVPGRTYQLQFETGGQGTNWQALGQVLADANGWFGFIDPEGSPQRIYRSVCP